MNEAADRRTEPECLLTHQQLLADWIDDKSLAEVYQIAIDAIDHMPLKHGDLQGAISVLADYRDNYDNRGPAFNDVAGRIMWDLVDYLKAVQEGES